MNLWITRLFYNNCCLRCVSHCKSPLTLCINCRFYVYLCFFRIYQFLPFGQFWAVYA